MAQIIKKHSQKTLILASIFLTLFLYYLIPQVSADTVTSRSDQLSDSRPSTASNHTITFTTPTGAANQDDTITITFDAAFNTATIVEDDVDVTSTSNGKLTTAADCSGSEELSVAMASDILTITVCDDGAGKITGSDVVVIEIGTNATASGTGSHQITNPALLGCTGSSSVCNIDVGGTFGDTGTMQVAIVAGVTASATVDETLTFTVSAVTDSNCTITGGVDKITTTSTTIPFGEGASVATEDFYDGCQALNAITNASSGYIVTVQELDQLTSGSDQIADGSCDGACDETTSATWATDTNNGFAYCMDDQGADNAAETAQPTQWASAKQCGGGSQSFMILPENDTDTPDTADIMESAGAVDDLSYIGYRLSVDSLQAPGSYTATIVYVITPTY